MKPRYIILITGILICIFSIVLIMLKGKPRDKVSFDAVSEIGESVLHHIDKTGHILTSVTDEEELKIGNKIHKKICARFGAEKFAGTPLDKYVNDIGNVVSKNVKRKDIRYKFHIVNAFYPNAFAIPGGHIYVTMGLIDGLKSEAELASILGHEITHVDAKHCIGAVQYKIAAEKILGADLETYADIGYHIFLRPGYSELQESEADAGGVYMAYKAGYHPLAMVSAFENICRVELSRKRKDSSITPFGDTVSAAGEMLSRYFATHPPVRDRMEKVKKYVSNNRLVAEKSKFYVGQRNYAERKSIKEIRYKEEFKKDYVIAKKKKIDKKATAKDKYEKAVNEIYTVHGWIYAGMDVAELEKMIPERLKTSEKATKIEYKDIVIYDFGSKSLRAKVALHIKLKNKKIRTINVITRYP